MQLATAGQRKKVLEDQNRSPTHFPLRLDELLHNEKRRANEDSTLNQPAAAPTPQPFSESARLLFFSCCYWKPSAAMHAAIKGLLFFSFEVQIIFGFFRDKCLLYIIRISLPPSAVKCPLRFIVLWSIQSTTFRKDFACHVQWSDDTALVK